MRTLPHGGTLRVLVGNLRIGLINFDPGRLVQAEHCGVFSEYLQTFIRIVISIRIQRQPVCQFGEKVVTGILYTADYIQRAVEARIFPAFDRRIGLLVFTGTVDGFINPDCPFLQSGNGRDRLKGGTGSLQRLGCVVSQRQRLIGIELGKIFRVGNPVVVIARVCDQSQNLSCSDIGDNTTGRTWIECKLGGCNLNISDFVHQKFKRIIIPAGTEAVNLRLVVGQNILGIQGEAQLFAGNHVVIDQVAVNLLCKLRIIGQILEHIIHQGGENIVGIGILTGDVQFRRIYPVAGNTVIEIIPEADGIVFPCLILCAFRVDGILDNDSGLITGEVGININHIRLHLLRKITHQSGVPG